MPITTERTMLFAAATAISAVGFLTVPAPAQANPCDNYQFPEGLMIKQDNNIDVGFGNPVTSTFHNEYASYEVNTFDHTFHGTQAQGGLTSGHANGGVTGTTIDFTIDWDSGPGAGLSNHYTGVVNANGTAQGMSVNSKGAQNVWASAPMKLSCVGAGQ